MQIPYTGDKFIDGLMERLDREYSNRLHAHRPVKEIQQSAYQYFIQFDPINNFATSAAEAVAKNRRTELDKANLRRMMQIVKSSRLEEIKQEHEAWLNDLEGYAVEAIASNDWSNFDRHVKEFREAL